MCISFLQRKSRQESDRVQSLVKTGILYNRQKIESLKPYFCHLTLVEDDNQKYSNLITLLKMTDWIESFIIYPQRNKVIRLVVE